MDVNGVGWIAAIIIGGLAGWLAEMVMKSRDGLLESLRPARNGRKRGGQ